VVDAKYSGRVSFERVVSGPGLTNIYTFLRDQKHMEEPEWLRQQMAAEDPNAVIGEVGEEGKSELCAKALEVFAAAYGAEAGNMVLKALATGGMYIGGGIAPKMLKTMRGGVFMQAFYRQGAVERIC